MIDPSMYKSKKAKLFAEALNEQEAMRTALLKIKWLEESKEPDSDRIAAAISIAKAGLRGEVSE